MGQPLSATCRHAFSAWSGTRWLRLGPLARHLLALRMDQTTLPISSYNSFLFHLCYNTKDFFMMSVAVKQSSLILFSIILSTWEANLSSVHPAPSTIKFDLKKGFTSWFPRSAISVPSCPYSATAPTAGHFFCYLENAWRGGHPWWAPQFGLRGARRG